MGEGKQDSVSTLLVPWLPYLIDSIEHSSSLSGKEKDKG